MATHFDGGIHTGHKALMPCVSVRKWGHTVGKGRGPGILVIVVVAILY
eukprot:COSAG02_NODE_4070_length_5834_cov_2.914908_2_plen_48_part_00